jgi:hypothetical protein
MVNKKVLDAFKKGFKEGIEKHGISIKESRIMLALTYDYAYGDSSHIIKDAMEKQAILGPLLKTVPISLMLGALVGAGSTLLKRRGQRKKFMYEKGVASKLDRLLQKMRAMEGIEVE